jgi:hypothetical protein
VEPEKDVTVVRLDALELLDRLVAHLRQEQGAIRILSDDEYQRLVASQISELAPGLLTAQPDSIRATLTEFDARFRGRASDLAHAALAADFRARHMKLRAQKTSAGRRAVIRDAFIAYAGLKELDDPRSWSRSFLGYIGDPPKEDPASDGLLLLAAATPRSLSSRQDLLLFTALHLDSKEEDERRAQAAPLTEEDPRRGGPADARIANEVHGGSMGSSACALPGSGWPWGEVLHIVIELGPSALAGAIASQLLESSIRWARRWLKSKDAPDEVIEVNVKIYAPNGHDVLREVTVSRDNEPAGQTHEPSGRTDL